MQGHGCRATDAGPRTSVPEDPQGAEGQQPEEDTGLWMGGGGGMDFRGSGTLTNSPLPVTPGAGQYLLQGNRDPHLLRCKLGRETCHMKE